MLISDPARVETTTARCKFKAENRSKGFSKRHAGLARPRPASPCPSPRRQLSPSRARCPSGSRADLALLQQLWGPCRVRRWRGQAALLVCTIHNGGASAALGWHAGCFDGRDERAERSRRGARPPLRMPKPLQPARGAGLTGVLTAAAHRIKRLRYVDFDARCASPSPLVRAPCARSLPALIRFVCSQVLPLSICSPAGPAAAATCADALYSSAVLAAAPAATFLAASSLSAVGAAAVAASERDTDALCCVMCVESRICSAGTSGFIRELDCVSSPASRADLPSWRSWARDVALPLSCMLVVSVRRDIGPFGPIRRLLSLVQSRVISAHMRSRCAHMPIETCPGSSPYCRTRPRLGFPRPGDLLR